MKERTFDRYSMWVFVLAALVCVWLLAGCKGRERTQAASDAYYGAEALILVAEEGGASPASIFRMHEILIGIQRHVLASRGISQLSELPAPTAKPAAIAADPPAYQARGAAAIEAAKSTGFWVWVGGVVLTALAIARQMNLGGPLVQLASMIAETRATREHKAVRDQLATIGEVMIREVEMAAPSIAQPIKAAVARALPADKFDDAIQTVAYNAPKPAPTLPSAV